MLSVLSRSLMQFLAEPRTRGLDLDDPETTVRRRDLAISKKSLNLSYRKWYAQFQEIDRLAPPGIRLELGSGGGFLADVIPGLVTTDVLPLPFVDMVCQAENLPQADGTVGAIFMINVLHHVCDVERFFEEAQRVLVGGGVVAMIEPYVSPFSRFVYTHLHHEPFDTAVTILEARGVRSFERGKRCAAVEYLCARSGDLRPALSRLGRGGGATAHLSFSPVEWWRHLAQSGPGQLHSRAAADGKPPGPIHSSCSGVCDDPPAEASRGGRPTTG